nr:hypothetical protein [Burkholderia multivorans]
MKLDKALSRLESESALLSRLSTEHLAYSRLRNTDSISDLPLCEAGVEQLADH